MSISTVNPNAEYQPDNFTFNAKSKKCIEEAISKYPKGREKSAVMQLLYIAQEQIGEEGANATPPYGGWIPRVAMDEIATILNMPQIKVYEVATFYTMYNLKPVGRYHIQFCGTTPCWLCRGGDVKKSCQEKLGIDIGETTDDGLFTLSEVECLGACANAPIAQINFDMYEDLTPERIKEIIDLLEQGKEVPYGSQTGRQCSMPASVTNSIKENI